MSWRVRDTMRKDLDAHELFRQVATTGERLDDDWVDDLDHLVCTEGRLVGRHEWDSGGPGAGAGTVDVYLFRTVYIAFDDVGAYGPYQTFDEAAEAVSLLRPTDATKRIWMAEDR